MDLDPGGKKRLSELSNKKKNTTQLKMTQRFEQTLH